MYILVYTIYSRYIFNNYITLYREWKTKLCDTISFLNSFLMLNKDKINYVAQDFSHLNE